MATVFRALFNCILYFYALCLINLLSSHSPVS
nr:MAG TPA: hypothetical protein [Caudoviricetes sp.]